MKKPKPIPCDHGGLQGHCDLCRAAPDSLRSEVIAETRQLTEVLKVWFDKVGQAFGPIERARATGAAMFVDAMFWRLVEVNRDLRRSEDENPNET